LLTKQLLAKVDGWYGANTLLFTHQQRKGTIEEEELFHG